MRPLVLVGMHRSRTSLLARWLQSCGLDIGDRLLAGDASNPQGHFEDLDFLTINRQILSENHVRYDTMRRPNIRVSTEIRKRASELIEKRMANAYPWGWKDPRTTLLLEFWDNALPDAQYIGIYRHYEEVVASMTHREAMGWSDKRRRYIRFMEWLGYRPRSEERFLKSWTVYNRAMLAFFQQYPDRCILITFEDLIHSAHNVIEYLIDGGLVHLRPMPVDRLRIPDEKKAESIRRVPYYYVEAAEKLLSELDEWRKGQPAHPYLKSNDDHG